jgi:hypothetical protein
METTSKINLKIGEIEVNIEGTADFVSEQYDKIHENLKSYVELTKEVVKKVHHQQPTVEKLPEVKTEINEGNGIKNELPESFGEWLNKLPKGTSDTDKALLAGYFNQVSVDGKIFKVRDVTKTLKDHGVKLSNPSNLIGLATKGKKYIFQFSKDGKQVNYRFSREGEEYIKGLITGETSK